MGLGKNIVFSVCGTLWVQKQQIVNCATCAFNSTPCSPAKRRVMNSILRGHFKDVTCVSLSCDKKYVVSSSCSGSMSRVVVHSTNSEEIEFRVDNIFSWVFGLCYLPNGSLVACGYDSGGANLKVLSPSLELVQTLEGHNGGVRCVTISPSGSHFASGGRYGKVIIWSESGEGGEWARVQVLDDHINYFNENLTGALSAVCFSPDGKQLATGSWDRLIKLYSFNESQTKTPHPSRKS